MNSTTLQAARRYLAQGWMPIPVPFRKKGAVIEGWPSLRPSQATLPSLFNGRRQNIGVLLGEPSRWLVDVDLDCSEAVDLADRLLPSTPMVFGRRSRHRAHRLYMAPGTRPIAFVNRTAGRKPHTLLELRATGQQTIFPPSVHPSGEPIVFEADTSAKPADIDAAELTQCAQRLAAATLLVRAGLTEGSAIAVINGDSSGLSRVPEATAALARQWLGGPQTMNPSSPSAAREAASPIGTTEFDEAVNRYNRDHARGWPDRHGTCPACGHNECFGRLPGTEDRWTCFSTAHEGPGLKGERCWHGDALDLDAYSQGLSRTALLRGEAYLTRSGQNQATDQSRRDLCHKHSADACAAVPTDEGTVVLAPSATSERDLPVIETANRQLRDMVADGWTALLATNDPPHLFRRGDAIVRMSSDSEVPALEKTTERAVYGLLARSATWIRTGSHNAKNVKPVKEVSADMVALPSRALPPIEGVVSFPVFDTNGRLVSQPGYHPQSRLWLHHPPGFALEPIPKLPSANDVNAATRLLLDELLADFPFEAESDRTHVIAALLLPLVRLMIGGPTPLHLIEAPTPGTGKSLLSEAIAHTVTGSGAVVMTIGRQDEEVRKRITSALRRGQRIIVLDNVRVGLQSSELAATLTASVWTDRVLGVTKLTDLPNRALWIATANNPALTLEIARRCIRIRLDARQDRPWASRTFKHHPLLAWVQAERHRLLGALLVLVRGWIGAGKPRGTRSLGSFESWAEVIGGVLEHAGITGFLDNLDELYESADRGTAEWRAFVLVWRRRYTSTWIRVSDLVTLAETSQLLHGVLGDGKPHSQRTRLGKALARMRGRQFDDLRIESQLNTHDKVTEYRISTDVSAGLGHRLVHVLPRAQ